MATVKQTDNENWTYYFYNDIIDIKNFDPILLKIDKKSYKDTSIYNIGYITIKKMMIIRVFIVWILCICLLIMWIDIWNKKG